MLYFFQFGFVEKPLQPAIRGLATVYLFGKSEMVSTIYVQRASEHKVRNVVHLIPDISGKDIFSKPTVLFYSPLLLI